MNQHLNEQYTPDFRALVWNKALPVDNIDPSIWRKDKAGAWINFSQYGDRDAQYGWEIDHVKPEAAGGPTNLDNLQPLHWKNNCSKGDTWPGRWVVDTASVPPSDPNQRNVPAPANTTCI